MELINIDPGCEIRSSRIVNASREKVFAAWTEPEHLKNWWGPAG
ncbi:MAG: SRPBCC domain-containing protein, partial [Flavisolibacter sp.]